MKESISKLMIFMKKTKISFDAEIELTATKLGISKSEADVLLFLSNNINYNRGCDIVEIRGFSKAYVSKAVGKLLNKGYISFKQDANDRRYQHIILNDSSKPLIIELNKVENNLFSY